MRSLSVLDRRLVLAAPGPDLEVLGDGELDERAPPLGHLADAELGDLLGRLADELLAVERDAALDPAQRSADRPQQGRLAGAVGAEHGDHRPLGDLEVDAVEDLDEAVPPVEVPDYEIVASCGS